MNKLEIRTLPFFSKVSICWSFFWRSGVVTLVSAACGALSGGVLGFIFALLGMPRSSISIAGGLAGLLIGLVSFYVLVRWLLSSRLGGFRLVLVNASDEI
jgi:ABC-type amino acid transport system permease subunit